MKITQEGNKIYIQNVSFEHSYNRYGLIGGSLEIFNKYILDEEFFVNKGKISIKKYAWIDIIDMQIYEHHELPWASAAWDFSFGSLFFIDLLFYLFYYKYRKHASVGLILKNPNSEQKAEFEKNGFHVRAITTLANERSNLEKIMVRMNEYREKYGQQA